MRKDYFDALIEELPDKQRYMKNKYSKVCPEFRPLMAQANAGEGPFQPGGGFDPHKTLHIRDELPHFTPYSPGEFKRQVSLVDGVLDEKPSPSWNPPFCSPQEEAAGKSLHEIGGYQPTGGGKGAHPPAAEPPAEDFKVMVDRFEAMCQRLEARQIKREALPTRERLLDAVRWALGEDDHHDGKQWRPGEMFRARLRRLAGL